MNDLNLVEQARKQRAKAHLKECRVRQGFISIDGVGYTAPIFAKFNGKTVKVEHIVNVYDENGNLIASKHNLGSANTLTSL